jgi:hypothetical protein
LPPLVREREVEGGVHAGSGRERVQGNVSQDKQIEPKEKGDGDLQNLSMHGSLCE